MSSDNEEEFDPSSLPKFTIPDSFLDQLFEFTGGPTGGDKGFVLVYIDQNGRPMVYTRSESQIIEMGLRKSMEKYLIDIEHTDGTLDLMDGEDDIPDF